MSEDSYVDSLVQGEVIVSSQSDRIKWVSKPA